MKSFALIVAFTLVACSAPPSSSEDGGAACAIDEAAQEYDRDAGVYAICHAGETDYVCADAARMQAMSCRWLGLGYNWCCPPPLQ